MSDEKCTCSGLDAEFANELEQLTPMEQEKMRLLMRCMLQPGFTEEYKKRCGSDREYLTVQEVERLMCEWVGLV